jgi:hypothetical protein
MENQELHDKLISAINGVSSKLDTANSTIGILKINQESIITRLGKIEDRMANLELKVSEINGRTHSLQNSKAPN